MEFTELDASCNNKIIDVNQMKNTLKILKCYSGKYSECGIDQNGISDISLIDLCASGNKSINNVNHMKNTLKFLFCAGNSGIDDKGVAELKTTEIYSRDNHKITKHFC